MLKLLPQRWHYSPPGLLSCCYNSSWLQDTLNRNFLNCIYVDILFTLMEGNNLLKLVHWTNGQSCISNDTLEGIPRLQFNPIKISCTSYFLALIVHRRARAVVFIDIIFDVSLTIPLRWSRMHTITHIGHCMGKIIRRYFILEYLRVTAAIPGDGGAEVPHTVDSEHDQNEEDPHHHRWQSHLCLQ